MNIKYDSFTVETLLSCEANNRFILYIRGKHNKLTHIPQIDRTQMRLLVLSCETGQTVAYLHIQQARNDVSIQYNTVLHSCEHY